jgi:signal transduction histidine kinase
VETETLFNEVVAELPELANPCVLSVSRPLHNVIAHPTLLKQCFHNLLQNAIKFVPSKVAPRIHVATSEEPPKPGSTVSRIRISVRDNGIGVDPSLHKKIFGIFERGVNAKQFEGTGIGLAIVAKAVDRMGGAAGVESEAGSGSCFWVELPAADAVTARAE